MTTCRFAPSTTGPAHPGTLVAALLGWLDARSRGARIILRLEDLDPDRCHPAFTSGLMDDLRWFGLDWDEVIEQHTLHHQHEAALDQLEQMGRLYPSPIGRSALKDIGRRAPDGAWAYDNRERGTPLPSGGWRACRDPLRVRLDDGVIAPIDEGGMSLALNPTIDCGDPIVRRRDGAVAYQLAVVVDDAAAGIDRIVRGRDIAMSTATQVALQRLLSLPTPVYRHHLLLLENQDKKLAKFHGAVGASELKKYYSAEQLCGWLAWCVGLLPRAVACNPQDLLKNFNWGQVIVDDVVVRWSGKELIKTAS